MIYLRYFILYEADIVTKVKKMIDNQLCIFLMLNNILKYFRKKIDVVVSKADLFIYNKVTQEI